MGRIGITDSAYYEGVAEKIREKLGVDEQYAPSQLAEKVVAVYDKGYEVGSAEGGNAEESYQQGYQEGKAEAYAEVESVNAELETALNGGDTGGKGYYDEFWDSTKNESGWPYRFAGVMWNTTTFRPTYDLKPTGNCNYAFNGNNIPVDLVKWLEDLGVTLTFSGMTSCMYIFSYSKFTRIGELDFRDLSSANSAFANARLLHTIDKIIVGANVQFPSAFNNTVELANITFEGVIGQAIDFKSCTKLTKSSIKNIIEHLSTTASGQTATFSKTAVETAFGSTTGAEWTALKATRSNWTISLV
jgi:hypothetical protein